MGVVEAAMYDECTRNRFWNKVKTGKPDECWEWQGRRQRGYGCFDLSSGKAVKAHRMSYQLVYGAIPAGMHICHHCDNPGCVNPSHLFVGTDKDNSDDKIRKGRANHPRGIGHGRAVLTENDVRTIRQRANEGRGIIKRMAREYGVSKTAISLIVRGINWKWLE